MAVCLLCTVIIEALAGFILGFRSLYSQAVIMLANVMTNPLLVSSGFCVWLLLGNRAYHISLAAMEALAVLAEAAVYKSAGTSGKALLHSLLMNICSFLIGGLIGRYLI